MQTVITCRTILLILLIAFGGRSVGQQLAPNPLPVALGDPYIIFDEQRDRYYMYGTGGTRNGFVAYSS
ncbi:MAG: hypothetical protein ACTHWQ_04500, partial [Sphingobacterium sp.]